MSGMTLFFMVVGVSVTVTKLFNFVEYIGGGNAYGKIKKNISVTAQPLPRRWISRPSRARWTMSAYAIV